MERGMAWCCSSASKSNNSIIFPFPPHRHRLLPNKSKSKSSNISFAAAARSSLSKRCQKCGGKGAIYCPGCKVTHPIPSLSQFSILNSISGHSLHSTHLHLLHLYLYIFSLVSGDWQKQEKRKHLRALEVTHSLNLLLLLQLKLI